MDKEQADATPAEAWLSSLNSTCNRLSTQYLNLLRAAAGGPSTVSSSSSSLMMAVNGPTMSTPSSNSSTLGLIAPKIGENTVASTSVSGGAGANNVNTFLDEHETRKQLDRSGGGQMRELNEPPPPLAADAALSTLQVKLAAENICVASCHLLDLIRTLRLSALLMEESVIAAEEEEEFIKVSQLAMQASLDSTKIEEELMVIRNNEVLVESESGK